MSDGALQEGVEGISVSHTVKLYLVNITCFHLEPSGTLTLQPQTKWLQKPQSQTTFLASQLLNWPDPLQRTWAVLCHFSLLPVDPQTVATITPWMKIGMNGSLVLIRFTTDSLVIVTLSCLISPVDPWSDGRVIRERAGLAGLWLIAEACDVDGKVKDVERTTPWVPPRRLTVLSNTRLCRCTQQGEKLLLTSW